MLCIRNEQMQHFEQVASLKFENEMVSHLSCFSPELCKVTGEEQMRKVIRFGIVRAESHGFTLRGPVRLYIELMLLFGSHFDTDPQYPWAVGILAGQDDGLQMQRAEMLFEKTMEYREKVIGPEDVYTLKALKNISAFARNPLGFSIENFVPAMRQELVRVYPQKVTYIGEEGLNALINEGVDLAKVQQFNTVRGGALLIFLMFTFGHGFGDDPLYPWIAHTLSDKNIMDVEARANRLETKALTWLDHVLAHFNKEKQA